MKDTTAAVLRTLCLAAPFVLAACQPQSDEASRSVDEAAKTAIERYQVPGLALARIEEHQVRWLASYGEAADGRSVSDDTLFNVASLTKPLFAVGYLHWAQDGQVDLDAPLADHWVDADIAEDPRLSELTARLALSHQSGFPNWRGSGELTFMFAPGQRHEYSGEGFEYVRRAAQQQTGSSLATLMQSAVLEPAGMTDTHFGWAPELADRLAAGYDEAGQPIDGYDLSDREPNAAANTFTTLGDYARFAAWVSNGAGLEPSYWDAMTEVQAAHPNPIEFWGLGWRLTQLPNRTLIEHDGREPGVRTQVIIDPEKGDGLVMLTNSSNGELIVRPLIKAVLPDADKVLTQRDLDTWTYLSSLPEPALPGLLGFVAQSPSFSMKLLYAAKAGLIDDSGLSKDELEFADEVLEALVYRQFDGELSADQMRALFLQLGEPTEQGFRFADQLGAEQSRQWLEAAQRISEAL